MANRKVLINRHTSGSSAPQSDSMYLGEIAVAHETGKETLFTKNNAGNMVPFISCAQTVAIIESMIETSDTDVMVKAGEQHLEVSAGTGAEANKFTLNTKDVQSESAFNDYSAATKVRIDKNASAITDMVNVVSALTNVVLTGISGDTIIVAEVLNPTTGANYVALTHRTGEETNGFKKLTTDAYGHVTASTDVLTADIQALGFKTSAETGEDLEELSGAVIANETHISELSAGTVHDIEELSGATEAISGYAHDEIAQLSGATQAISGYAHDEIAALSAGTIQLSADTKATIEQLSAGTIMVSGYAHGEIVELSGATVSAFTAILGMDKAADAVAGQVVTTISEVDGVVSETKANVKDLQLGGYVKDTTATGDIASADTINAALSKLENKANAITIANADGSINVTTGATGTDINVNIKSGEHVLAKDGNAGLYTNIKLSGVSPSSDLVKEEYVLYGTDNTVLGDHIKIYKDQSLVSISVEDNDGSGHTGQYLKYTYIDASGATQSTYVNISSFLIEAEFKSGVTADASGVVHGVVDPTSEKDSNNDSFLTVGADGFKVDGIKDEIDAKIAALDVTGDTAAAGQYVAAIEQTNGVVAVKTRANVSAAVLNNYAKGTDGSAVAATDTVNEAISKLENQVDAAKAAATTKVVEGTDAGNNMTITPTTSATDGSVTYTIDLTDVASDAALEAVSGIVNTFSAATVAEFNSAFTTINTLSGFAHNSMIARDDAVFSSAKTYTDEQIDEVYASGVSYTDAKVAAEIALLDSSTAVTTGKYITGIAIADGKISGITEESLPANVVITATTATPVDTASAVLTGVTADGTDNHNLTFGMSNKVFSAETSDSALTTVHANAATKVDSALTINIIDATGGTATTVFDGSENKTINLTNTDTATTEAGHYAPATAASAFTAPAGSFLSGVSVDSKNHVLEVAYADKINSATTSESADTAAVADKVANALSISGYSSETAATLDTAIAYDGSNAQSLTFGTVGNAGLNSMSTTSAGVVDVDVIDCGTY